MRKLEIDLLRFVRRATREDLMSLVPDLADSDLEKEPQRGPFEGQLPFATLVRINEVLAPEPPRSPKPSYCWSRERRARVLAKRRAAGFDLWHPADIVNLDTTSCVGENIYRVIYRLADYKRAGCPTDDVESEPLCNGADCVGRVHLRGEQPANDGGPVARILPDQHQIRKAAGQHIKRKEA